jgi:hypothetical protein
MVETELFLSLPEFMWNGIFNIIVTLGAGLIIAFVTTFYLKKKDEITRVAGVILEKRVNTSQEILNYLEKLSFKKEFKTGDEFDLYKILKEYDFHLPYEPHLQYSEVFESMDNFREFFHGFENIIATNKLWLNTKVRDHLFFMQGYFANINALIIFTGRVPVPKEMALSVEDVNAIANSTILPIGITLDYEISELIAELETLIVDSVYNLDLERPKNTPVRNTFLNNDVKNIQKKLKKTLLYTEQEKYASLISTAVYEYLG